MLDVFIFGHNKTLSEILKGFLSCQRDVKKNKIAHKIFIIFDGCKLKTDQTKQINIIEKIKRKLEKENLEIIQMNVNKGISYCRNEAIKKSKSKFIFFLDGDDYIVKNKLSLSLKILKKNASVTAVYTDYYLNNRSIRSHHSKITNEELYNYISVPAPMSNLVYRTSRIKKSRFDTKMNFLEDFDFLLNLKNPQFILCPKILLKINHKKKYDRYNELINRIRLVKKNRDLLNINTSINYIVVGFLLVVYEFNFLKSLRAIILIMTQLSISDRYLFLKMILPIIFSRVYKKLKKIIK